MSEADPGTMATDRATRTRLGIVLVTLAVTAVIAIPFGILWPEPSGANDSYVYADIAPIRVRFWALLVLLGAMLAVNVATQAIATLVLVRERGARWATWGAALMWPGAALQGAGAAFLAGAFFFATDPAVSTAEAAPVIEAAAQDFGHLWGAILVGAVAVMIGTVLQAVGLIRAHVVPLWVPIATLFSILTFVVPGNGWIGLITSVPMAAGAIGLAYFAWRRISAG